MSDEETIVDDGNVMDTTSTPPLTAVDRCDACGAQAYVRLVSIKTGRDLLMCGHHFHTMEDSATFNEEEWYIWDERAKLNQKVDVSP